MKLGVDLALLDGVGVDVLLLTWGRLELPLGMLVELHGLVVEA